MKKTRIWKDF